MYLKILHNNLENFMKFNLNPTEWTNKEIEQGFRFPTMKDTILVQEDMAARAVSLEKGLAELRIIRARKELQDSINAYKKLTREDYKE